MIQLDVNQLNEIAAHGEFDYPSECCGVLLGSLDENGAKSVSEIYRISNAREESAKRNRFLITPGELVKAERYAGSRKMEVLGFYHSHPDHPALPSQYDLDHAWPVYSYIIVSVTAGDAVDLRSWQLEANRSRFIEEEILKGS